MYLKGSEPELEEITDLHMLGFMRVAPETNLRLQEVSFIAGLPIVAIRCGDHLAEPAHAFRENLKRSLALAELPSRLAGWSSLSSLVDTIARLGAGGSLSSDSHDEGSLNYDAVIGGHYRKLHTDAWAKVAKDPKLTTDNIKNIGLAKIDILIASSAAHLETGLESILVGASLGAWTAFEALVSDIWEIALNVGPKDWARSIVRKPTEAQGQEKSFPLSVLDELGFDLSEKMGTLLKRQKKVDFQSLKSIRAAYKGAFGADADSIFGKHPELIALEAMRNLFAHRGGKVDERFKRQTSEHPKFASAEIGSQLVIDGPLTKLFLDEAVNCGVELLHLIDDKLAAYQETHSSQGGAVIETLRMIKRDGPANWKGPSRWRMFLIFLRQIFR